MEQAWGAFPKQENCFPKELLETLYQECHLKGSLGHCHASGTEIIARLGEESEKTNKPIFYTSIDSVFQIAAHKETFGLSALYELCEVARKLLVEMRIARVIARPFTGSPGSYERTGDRRDYSLAPPGETVLDRLAQACLLYTSPSPRDLSTSRMPSSA